MRRRRRRVGVGHWETGVVTEGQYGEKIRSLCSIKDGNVNKTTDGLAGLETYRLLGMRSPE